ncbi:MAG: hypothetical protein FWG65_05965 [Turicibacter sp.]|nr:hypothetical protein [Turicibacter sp.]
MNIVDKVIDKAIDKALGVEDEENQGKSTIGDKLSDLGGKLANSAGKTSEKTGDLATDLAAQMIDEEVGMGKKIGGKAIEFFTVLLNKADDTQLAKTAKLALRSGVFGAAAATGVGIPVGLAAAGGSVVLYRIRKGLKNRRIASKQQSESGFMTEEDISKMAIKNGVKLEKTALKETDIKSFDPIAKEFGIKYSIHIVNVPDVVQVTLDTADLAKMQADFNTDLGCPSFLNECVNNPRDQSQDGTKTTIEVNKQNSEYFKNYVKANNIIYTAKPHPAEYLLVFQSQEATQFELAFSKYSEMREAQIEQNKGKVVDIDTALDKLQDLTQLPTPSAKNRDKEAR